ncbi:uncharacterized protein LOC105847681 isoform X1 [Hydra vulgaris]|uniref:uncharacterized protein LOC105847681 isoform X1 n=1 Tax=Hydra vulgaris TaxID=6087 RepID=UPI0006410ACF|nr:uncharacterized protein LOC105847681 [Hydra vulgaris]
MASLRREHVKFPSPQEVEISRHLLKPAGIMSNNYNKWGLKKIEERKYVSSKDYGNNLTWELSEEEKSLLKDKSCFSKVDKRPEKLQISSKKSLYDIINHIEYGYDPKLHRDDRTMCHLSINEEEMNSKVPATTNGVYGNKNRYLLEQGSQYGHRETCRKEFSEKSFLFSS